MLLEASGLSMQYGGESIFDHIDLRLDAGCALAITGPSGCGKSTLLSILGLLLSPTQGHVLYNGRPASAMSDMERSALRNTSIGFLFQHIQLIGSLSALDNLLVPALLARRRGMEGRAKRLMEELGLGERMHHYPHQLSIGQKRRVALARALIMQPELMIADEPTNDLDPTNAEIVSSALLNLPSQGCGLILATHDRELAQKTGGILNMK